jgi:poly(3-hydroxybutyrate) depolymerase
MLRNLLVFAFCIIAKSASAQVDLGSYNVNPNTVTVAGISSGGFMAVQLQVALEHLWHGGVCGRRVFLRAV